MSQGSREDIAKAAIVTSEVLGHELSPAAAMAIARELSAYASADVATALRRCTRELRGRLSLADILQRMPGQHLGADEAWALCPRGEDSTVVWTDEIAGAYGVAAPLLAQGDQVAARMAFRDAYARAVSAADGPPKWSPSLGSDSAQRLTVVLQAVKLGRLPRAHAESVVGPLELPGDTAAAALPVSGEGSAPLAALLAGKARVVA